MNDGGASVACAWGDVDQDGFLDLFVANLRNQSNFFYHNNGNNNSWLKVRCVGTVSNRSAIGAKVRVKATIRGKTLWQLREMTGGDGRNGQTLIAHFGLGDAARVDTLRIEWPSGIVQELRNVAVKQSLTITEPPRLRASLDNGQFRLSLPGGKGFVYEVQRSTNLIDWTPVATLTNMTGQLEFTDPDHSTQQQRFYRAMVK